MKNTFGNNISVTLFGESHGPFVGAVLDGITPGLPVRLDFIREKLSARRPKVDISTSRVEPDDFTIVSGVFEGKTTGTPLTVLVPNADTDGSAYEKHYGIARPSSADYPAFMKYHGFEDYRGGGHFSGRLTVALVAVGAILTDALSAKGITFGTHISALGKVVDRSFNDEHLKADIELLHNKEFPTLDDETETYMKDEILLAKADGDSVGGVLETVIDGLPAGVGEPWFDSVESVLSHLLFSIPAVKGVEFGEGFGFGSMRGSMANDSYRVQNGKIVTKTNRAGGIGGGITNGMPVLFRTAVKPTPSILKEQETVNFKTGENTVLSTVGRHDPSIVPRVAPVIDAVTAIALCDLYVTRYGTDSLL